MSGVKVGIGADSSKAERELSSFERKTRKIAKSIQKGFQERIGHKLFDGMTSAARAVPGFLNSAIQSASDLNEEIGKSELLFGDSANMIQKWAEGTAMSLGMSKLEALQATGAFGGFFNAIGKTKKESADMSLKMAKLAVDLGSLYNTSTEEAIYALGAAMRGESEPMRRFNVFLEDGKLKAEAFALGLYDGKGPLDSLTKSLATYSFILKSTTIANDNFADTSDGLANSQKQLNAQFENAKLAVGEGLLPAMQSLVDILNNMNFEEIGKDVGSLAKSFVDLGSSIRDSFVGFRMLARYVTFDFEGAEKMKADEIQKKMGQNTIELTEEGKILLHGTEEQKKALIEKLDLQEEELKKQEELSSGKDQQSREEFEYIQRLSDLQNELARNEIANAQKVAETKKKLLEQEEEQRQKIAEITRDQYQDLSMREAEALAEFGIDKALEKTRLQELLGMGLAEKDAVEISGRENNLRKLQKTQDLLSTLSGRSSVTAVSSMQRIGGGGGVSTELDLQKRQASLQEQMVELLKGIKDQNPRKSISDF